MKIKLNDKNTFIGLYGSYVYGTNHHQSDIDLIIISDIDDIDFFKKHIQSNQEIDIHLFNKDYFQTLLKKQEINALETLMLKDDKILKSSDDFVDIKKIFFEQAWLDKEMLRSSISQKASNSWVKGKKKFLVEKDFNPYIGKKSIWHAFRMLEFGTQIAREGYIYDYSAENSRLNEILECENWNEIEERFKLKFNEKNSEFRRFAPKKIEIRGLK